MKSPSGRHLPQSRRRESLRYPTLNKLPQPAPPLDHFSPQPIPNSALVNISQIFEHHKVSLAQPHGRILPQSRAKSPPPKLLFFFPFLPLPAPAFIIAFDHSRGINCRSSLEGSRQIRVFFFSLSQVDPALMTSAVCVWPSSPSAPVS